MRLICGLGMEARVTLTGFVGDVTPYLARSDLLVLPSVYEGLPAVVLEALAANCPVLATDCFPCARELLTPVAGCAIIELPEPAALASQIRACLGVPPTGAIAQAAMPYTIEAGVESHVAALKKVLLAG
jgi:glycosyltransferase involved in cell wall biosynthesis